MTQDAFHDSWLSEYQLFRANQNNSEMHLPVKKIYGFVTFLVFAALPRKS